MTTLSKEQIIAAKDIKTKVVDVPEWGGSVIIREMSGKVREEFEMFVQERRSADDSLNLRGMRTLVLSQTLVDEEGNALFTKDDMSVLGEKNAAVIDKLFTVAMTLNKIGDTQMKELRKNSDLGATDFSGSKLHDNLDIVSEKLKKESAVPSSQNG